MSGLANKITGNSMFVFVIVGFAVAIIMGIDAMDSFEEAIYNALTTAFSFLPVIAILGALSYISGGRK